MPLDISATDYTRRTKIPCAFAPRDHLLVGGMQSNGLRVEIRRISPHEPVMILNEDGARTLMGALVAAFPGLAPVEPKAAAEPERFDAPTLEVIREAASRAASAIGDAFIWGATAEGHDYWQGIADRLDEMAEGNLHLPPAPPPASTLPSPLTDYLTACPVGYLTAISWLAIKIASGAPREAHLPEVLGTLGEAADCTQRDGWWLARRCRERGIPAVWVEAPPVLQAQGIDKVRAYPVDLLEERLGA